LPLKIQLLPNLAFSFTEPAVLFGRSNFHHVAANVHNLGPSEAISRVADMKPDYDAYLWWFLLGMSIHSGKPDANTKILDAIKRAGWVA
jgi:hypothetical protein